MKNKDIDISEYLDDDLEYGKKYALIGLTIDILIYAISIISAILTAFLVRKVCLNDAFIIDNKSNYILSLISGVGMGTGIIFLFGKKLVLRFTDEKYKEYVSARLDWDMKNYNIFWKIISKIVAVIVIAGSLLFGAVSLNMVGLCDDCIKQTVLPFGTETTSYDNVEIYKLRSYYDTDKEMYLQYEKNSYALVLNELDIVLIDECDSESDTDKAIKSIAKRYNKEIKSISNSEELYDIYYEEEI